MDKGYLPIMEELQRENRELREEVKRLRKELKELKNARVRCEGEVIPVPLFVTRYIIKQGYYKRCDRVVYPEVPDTVGW